jgi:predicted transglutaminase-like cysteine proteinase
VRQAVKTLLLVAAVTATATAVQRDTAVQVDRLAAAHSSLPPTPDADRTQPTYYGNADFGNVSSPPAHGYPLQLVSLGNWSEPKSYFDSLQHAPLGEVQSSKPMTEPNQAASIDRNEKLKSYSAPRQVKPRIVRIQFNTPVLAPMAHTFFCLQYPSECKVRKIVFRGGAIKLTAERRAELERVNDEVNRAIIPERNVEGLTGEKWLISPKSGDCNDYAVTKRHKLLASGWSARARSSEVVTMRGDIIWCWWCTHDGDFVADNSIPKSAFGLKRLISRCDPVTEQSIILVR